MPSSIIQPKQISPGIGSFLNTDGAVERVIGLSTTGGVVRDEMRKWILGYNRFLGKCSAFDTELWVILDGLLLLQKQGYDKITIQLDNLEVVKTICDNRSVQRCSFMITRIQQVLSRKDK